MPSFVAIDFETSGRELHLACSVGLVRMEDGRVVDSWSTLIRPPSPRVAFTWVHGLTWPMLRNAPPFAEAWPSMAAFMSGADGLVAHNAQFDRAVLHGCCRTFGCPHVDIPFYCTLKGSRAALDLPSYRLDAVSAHFGIALAHHQALSDAMACGLIFLRLLRDGLPAERMKIGLPRQKTQPAGRARPSFRSPF